MGIKETLEKSKRARLLMDNPTAKTVAEIIVDEKVEHEVEELEVKIKAGDTDVMGAVEALRREMSGKIEEVELTPGESGVTPIKNKDYFDGKEGRNPLKVSKTEPDNPQIGDLWYQPD